MKKILFVNPPNIPYNHGRLLMQPVDILIIATYLKSKGHTVSIVDMDVEKKPPEQIKMNVKKFNPNYVVMIWDYYLPLHNNSFMRTSFKIAKIAKALKPKIKIIVIGKEATFQPQKFIYKDSPYDIAIQGEAEIPLLKIVSNKEYSDIKGVAFLSKNGELATNGLGEKIKLDQLPKPDRTLLKIENYNDVVSTFNSRGCINNCIFCGVPHFWGRWRSKSANLVVDEITELVEKFNIKKVMFLEDNSNVSNERLQQISNLLIKRKISVLLGCLGTIRDYDENTMKLMYKAGFRWIHYGLESGDNNQLKKIGKGVDSEKIFDVISKSKRIGYRVRTSFIVDLPDATKVHIDKTLKLLLKAKPHEVRMHFLVPKAGSFVYKTLLKKTNNDQLFSQYIHSSKSQYNLTKMSTNEIYKSVDLIITKLRENGYFIIKKPNEITNTIENHPNPYILSLCPLQYGLGWKY